MKNKGEILNYHEGLSVNQVRIILAELGLDERRFGKWLDGQTCPIVVRHDNSGRQVQAGGVYEYDLFRWINNQRRGTPLIWD